MIESTSPVEKQNVASLRKIFGDRVISINDATLLKWIRANKGDMELVLNNLAKHLAFRKAWDLDHIKEWIPPESAKFFGAYTSGYDRVGNAILIHPFGAIDVVGLMKSISASDYIRTSLRNLELALEKADLSAKERGTPYKRVYYIIDLIGDIEETYTFSVFTNTFLTLVSLVTENYPLVFKKICTIRTPQMAHFGFSLVKPFLGVDTTELVHMTGDDWQSMLSSDIDIAQLPEYYGGFRPNAESGNKTGVVPKSLYYNQPVPDNLEEIEVHNGAKRSLPFHVFVKGTKLKWWYQTLQEDIGFQILFQPNNNDSLDLQVLFPCIRLETLLVPEVGSMVCAETGMYSVEFDNTYSWFSTKKLKYRIDLIEPSKD